MSKTAFSAVATAAVLAAAAMAMPTAASAQSNGITNCDAPGGRQRTGAAIGAVVGGLIGSQVADNERTLGAVVGAGAGAAAGSYIGCRQQRDRANQNYGQVASNTYRATSNLRVRSGPSTRSSQIGSLSAGQTFQVRGSEGEWVQLENGGWVNANYVAPY